LPERPLCVPHVMPERFDLSAIEQLANALARARPAARRAS
jgi:hypothetical protein